MCRVSTLGHLCMPGHTSKAPSPSPEPLGKIPFFKGTSCLCWGSVSPPLQHRRLVYPSLEVRGGALQPDPRTWVPLNSLGETKWCGGAAPQVQRFVLGTCSDGTCCLRPSTGDCPRTVPGPPRPLPRTCLLNDQTTGWGTRAAAFSTVVLPNTSPRRHALKNKSLCCHQVCGAPFLPESLYIRHLVSPRHLAVNTADLKPSFTQEPNITWNTY